MSNIVHFTQLPSELENMTDSEQKLIIEKKLQRTKDMKYPSESDTALGEEHAAKEMTGVKGISLNSAETIHVEDFEEHHPEAEMYCISGTPVYDECSCEEEETTECQEDYTNKESQPDNM
ncbi:hypothetical protein LSTR_LSTR015420 [Laodelphax striatellus]|uniref:Uncharacterized protein n=1 Tax=Laodelphax striatellus TaxID=195883 RepID=A0A482X7R3_LAOST|nr:hypothetical protein LSTR_LSTR015420 [Laodelphax striatellus]